MVELVFEDPPEYRPRELRGQYDVHRNADRGQIVTELQHHPGRWAVVSRHASRNRASQVARLLRGRHPAPYEFRPARNQQGEGVVYGRYAAPDANI